MMDASNTEHNKAQEIFSRTLRAGRRTYFFDVRETKAQDYYLTITESKKSTHEDGEVSYRKHKIYLYKEDFTKFTELLNESIDFIFDKKGEEVISEIHQKDYKHLDIEKSEDTTENETSDFTDVDFDDI